MATANAHPEPAVSTSSHQSIPKPPIHPCLSSAGVADHAPKQPPQADENRVPARRGTPRHSTGWTVVHTVSYHRDTSNDTRESAHQSSGQPLLCSVQNIEENHLPELDCLRNHVVEDARHERNRQIRRPSSPSTSNMAIQGDSSPQDVVLANSTRMGSLTSPFDALPDEILATIIHYSRRYVEYRDAGGNVEWHIPIHFIYVCRRWLKLIRKTPKFWTHIRVAKGTHPDTVRQQLQRTKSAPLSIWIHRAAVRNSAVLDVLALCRDRWEGLFVENRLLNQHDDNGTPVQLSPYDVDIGNWVDGLLPNLKFFHAGGMSLGSRDGMETTLALRSLRWLSFCNSIPRFRVVETTRLRELRMEGCWLPVGTLFRYLQDASASLQILHFDGGPIIGGANRHQVPLVLMPSLEVVHIKSTSGYNGLGVDLLTNIRAPSLRSWTYRGTTDDWLQWRKTEASFPNLEVLDFEGQPMPPQAFSEVLSGAPRLRRLTAPLGKTPLAKGLLVDMIHEYGSAGAGCLEELRVEGWAMADLVDVVRANRRVRSLVANNITPTDTTSNLTGSDAVPWLQDRVGDLSLSMVGDGSDR